MDHSHHTHHHGQTHGETPRKHSYSDRHASQDARGHHGHDKHAGHHTGDFKTRFIVCCVVTVPVLALSHMVQEWLGFRIAFTGDHVVLAILSTFIFLYGGYPFLKGLYDEVRDRAIGMMTLIGVAITVAWAYSVAITAGLEGMDFYWEMATLIDIMLIGHYFEMRSVTGASRSLEMLARLMPAKAHRLHDGNIQDVGIEEVQKGDLLKVKPGEKVPVDAVVKEGNSYVDESMLTGESKPVKKAEGARVIGGSVNGNGALTVEVTGTGSETYLNRVIRLVDDAQKIKSRTQNFADRAAKVLTFVALGGGALTLCVWLALGHPFVFALERMVTVMVISCPHALGLAVPLVVAISTSMAARRGLLIRNRTAFENARLITTVIFDKTGTLTKGSHRLRQMVSLDEGIDNNEVLRLAAAVEQHSEHYIASGILRKAQELKIEVPAAADFGYIPGMGVKAVVADRKVAVTGPGYLRKNNIPVPGGNRETGTQVFVMVDDAVAGYLVFEDEIREDSAEAVAVLKERGISNLLLTGDNEEVASKVSDQLKMDGYFANVLPHEKQEKVKDLQKKGEFVAMTGDGVNDAPALAQADVGIAVGSGTDVAAETADIILVNSRPRDIADLILFGRATYRKMIQNLWWAAGYNIVAMPLAAGVLYRQGIMLSPAVGAVLMSLSTVVVAFNAMTLKRSGVTSSPSPSKK